MHKIKNSSICIQIDTISVENSSNCNKWTLFLSSVPTYVNFQHMLTFIFILSRNINNYRKIIFSIWLFYIHYKYAHSNIKLHESTWIYKFTLLHFKRPRKKTLQRVINFHLNEIIPLWWFLRLRYPRNINNANRPVNYNS